MLSVFCVSCCIYVCGLSCCCIVICNLLIVAVVCGFFVVCCMLYVLLFVGVAVCALPSCWVAGVFVVG